MIATRPSFSRVVDSLVEEFGSRVDRCRDLTERCVAEEARRIGDVPVRQFLEILVHKAARQRLRSTVDGERGVRLGT